jgi:hypothetical protein
MEYADVQSARGLSGIWFALRLYYSRRDVWSLTDEMRARIDTPYAEETKNAWCRWQRNRFHLQLGHCDTKSLFRAYYGDDPRPTMEAQGRSPSGPSAGGDSQGGSGGAQAYRRSRLSPLARLLRGRSFLKPTLSSPGEA